MKWRLDPGPIEVVDDDVAEILRRMTPAQRIARGLELFEFASNVIRTRLHAEHPDWPEERLSQETARRMMKNEDQ